MTLNRNRKDGKDVEFARRREKDKRGMEQNDMPGWGVTRLASFSRSPHLSSMAPASQAKLPDLGAWNSWMANLSFLWVRKGTRRAAAVNARVSPHWAPCRRLVAHLR
jgi:hypothetical protein